MSIRSVPPAMKALVTQANKTFAVEDVPVPSIDADQILVQTVAVALNPTDWKYVHNITNPGTICGCDWSGYVAKVGAAVTTFNVGDHVTGSTRGGAFADTGAFAEYVKVSADLVWQVPANALSHEQAATMGCAFWTAVQALFHPTRLGLVEPPRQVQEEKWVFIYGGSSSVGMFAIQLARTAGYLVATVTSPRNFELCKSLGANVVFDYKDPDMVSKIQHATNNSIHAAFDTISTAETETLAVKTFGDGPGKLIVLLSIEASAQALRPDVVVQQTRVYTCLGRPFSRGAELIPAPPEDRAHMATFLTKVPQLVVSGAVKPNPIKRWEGGLANITEGLQYMKEGKNSGVKIVYLI